MFERLKKQIRRRPLLSLVLLFAVMLVAFVFVFFRYTKTTGDVIIPEIVTTAEQLSDDYSFNEIVANEKYRGKYIQLSGMMFRVSQYNLSKGVITMDADITITLFDVPTQDLLKIKQRKYITHHRRLSV